jgi:hypothetical protein
MDRKFADKLIFTLNIIKALYEETENEGPEEILLQPLIECAMQIATTLHLPTDFNEDGTIEQWIHISDDAIANTNSVLQERHIYDDAS